MVTDGGGPLYAGYVPTVVAGQIRSDLKTAVAACGHGLRSDPIQPVRHVPCAAEVIDGGPMHTMLDGGSLSGSG